jgi:hypothetical protein
LAHATVIRCDAVALASAAPAELGGQLLEDDALRPGGIAEVHHHRDLFLLLVRERHTHAG